MSRISTVVVQGQHMRRKGEDGVLLCVAVCCSVVQRGVLQRVAACYSVLQRVAAATSDRVTPFGILL